MYRGDSPASSAREPSDTSAPERAFKTVLEAMIAAKHNGHLSMAATKFGERLQLLGVPAVKPKNQKEYAFVVTRKYLLGAV